eukprot:3382641-Amphidinium_carterae.1
MLDGGQRQRGRRHKSIGRYIAHALMGGQDRAGKGVHVLCTLRDRIHVSFRHVQKSMMKCNGNAQLNIRELPGATYVIKPISKSIPVVLGDFKSKCNRGQETTHGVCCEAFRWMIT